MAPGPTSAPPTAADASNAASGPHFSPQCATAWNKQCRGNGLRSSLLLRSSGTPTANPLMWRRTPTNAQHLVNSVVTNNSLRAIDKRYWYDIIAILKSGRLSHFLRGGESHESGKAGAYGEWLDDAGRRDSDFLRRGGIVVAVCSLGHRSGTRESDSELLAAGGKRLDLRLGRFSCAAAISRYSRTKGGC